MESIPFLKSRYLGRNVYLDEVRHLNDDNLSLLDTEVNGIQTDTAFFLREQELSGKPVAHTVTYERLLKSANRFAYAIEMERNRRQRQTSILELVQELDRVTKERDALKGQVSQTPARRVA